MLMKNTRIKNWICMLLACVILLSMPLFPAQAAAALTSAPLSRGATQNGMVRVRLSSLGNPSSLKLTVNGSYTINGKTAKAISSGSVLQVGFSASTGKLTLTHNGVTTDMGSTFKLRRHATDGSNGIKIAQGRVPTNLYPGDFEFISQKSSSGYTLYVIVHVYIEDYLYGVLPYEMGNSSGLEALKAQAVAARTYTLRAMGGPSTSIYDVVDTASDQVYSGTPSGNANCKAAVDATKGIVAKNGSALTATYYSASNGGQTESIKNIWGSNTYTYLMQVKDDPYDLANPASKKKTFTVNGSGSQGNATLQSLLNNKASSKFGTGAQVTGVTDIRLHTPKYPSPSKLYTKADFTVRYNRNGSTQTGTVTFDIFNELESPLGMSINSGSNELWSVEKTSSGFTVYARRYGHGLGMSQRGAMYMAQIGYTYDQILAFYYEGCTRVQYTFTRSILSPVISGQESSEETIIETPAEIEGVSEYTGTVKTDGTPLTDAATGAARTMTTLPKGAKVTVHHQYGDQYLVTYGSLCGYVAVHAVEYSGSGNGTASSPTKLYGYGKVVNSNALNLRTAPTMTGSNVMTTVPGKTVLPIFSVNGQWAYVQYGLRVGYVSMDYIELTTVPLNNVPSSPTASPESGNTLRAKVTTANGSLNLRKRASSSAAVLTTIPQFTVITVLDQGSSWCHVTYNGHEGYVMTKFLTFVSQEEPDITKPVATSTPIPTQAPSVTEKQYARVTTASGSLNLRQYNTSNARILRTIPQYEVIEVYKIMGDWCYVEYNRTIGYVMRKFLTIVDAPVAPTQKPVTQAPATPSPTPMPTAKPQANGNYARVTTRQGSLNLRETANGRVLCTIPQYEVIEVITKGSQWCRVSYNGRVGYVMTSFLTFLTTSDAEKPTVPPTPVPTAAPKPTQAPVTQGNYARVTTDEGSLNLRQIPNGRVLLTIPQYEIVTVLSKGSTWTQVNYQGTTGYVMTKFLTFVQNVPANPSTPKPTTPPQSSQNNAAQNGNVVCYATVQTASGSLNMRQTADADARVIATIPQWAQIPVYQKGTVWSKVYYNGQIGYVMSAFLHFSASASSNQSSSNNSTTSGKYLDPTLKNLDSVVLGRVVSGGTFLNLREYCDTEARVLDEMPQYTYIVITMVGDEWCKVVFEDKEGYCMRKYLEFDLP